MTNGDVMVQILSEVLNKPKESVAELLENFTRAYPGKHRFNDEISDEEAEKMLVELRKEKAGILSWLIQAGMTAKGTEGHA